MDVVARVWWCNDFGSRCSCVGLIFDRGLRFFFFFFGVDGRLWLLVVVVALGVHSVAMVVIVVLEQKAREKKNK